MLLCAEGLNHFFSDFSGKRPFVLQFPCTAVKVVGAGKQSLPVSGAVGADDELAFFHGADVGGAVESDGFALGLFGHDDSSL